MKGAAGGEVLAGLSEFDPPVDHLDDVDPVEKVVDKFFGDAGHGATRSARPLAVQLGFDELGDFTHVRATL